MSASLMPWIKARFTDLAGGPLDGGKVYAYIAGSLVDATTYTDATQTTANTNPIILDIRGEANIWLADNVIYDIKLTDAEGNDIYKIEDVSTSVSENDGKVFISSNDTTSGFLDDKITVGSNMTKNVINPSSNESLELNALDEKVKATSGGTADFLENKISGGLGVNTSVVSDTVQIDVDRDAFASSVFNSSDTQTIVLGATSKLDILTTYDPDSVISGNTFTAPSNGIYDFNFNSQIETGAGTSLPNGAYSYTISFYKNGSPVTFKDAQFTIDTSNPNLSTNGAQFSLYEQYELTAGDTIEVYCFNAPLPFSANSLEIDYTFNGRSVSGQKGDKGLNWLGTWSAGTYSENDAVYYEGSSYVSNVSLNTETPSDVATNWDLLALEGTAGLNWLGAWSAGTYALNDGVNHEGSSWISLTAGNTEEPSGSAVNWDYLAVGYDGTSANNGEILYQLGSVITGIAGSLWNGTLALFPKLGTTLNPDIDTALDTKTETVSFTDGNIAEYDSNGNIVDSTKKTSDFLEIGNAVLLTTQQTVNGEKLWKDTSSQSATYWVDETAQTFDVFSDTYFSRGFDVNMDSDNYTLLNVSNPFVGDHSPIQSFDNGESWEELTFSFTPNFLTRFVQNPYTKRYFAIGINGSAQGAYFYSDDKVNWTTVVPSVSYENILSIEFLPVSATYTSGAVVFGLGTGSGDADIVVSTDDGATVGTPSTVDPNGERVLWLTLSPDESTLYACLGTGANDGQVWSALITDLTSWTQETSLSSLETVKKLIFADNGMAFFITGNDAAEGDVYKVVGEDFANATAIGLATDAIIRIDCFGPVIAFTNKKTIYISYDYLATAPIEIDVTDITRDGAFGFTSTGRLLYEFNSADDDANTTLNYLDVGFMKANKDQTTIKELSFDVIANDVQKFRNTDGTYRYDYGNQSAEPTSPTATANSTYYNTTENIPYIYNGTDWLQVTAGASFGQLRCIRNTTAQTGFTSTFQKVTQFTTNGIEEGGVVVDLVNDEIDIPEGTWEISISTDMNTSANNVVITLGVFDVTDTGFASPYVERERKIGTGSDIGAISASGYIEATGTTTIAMYGASDASTSLTLKNANFSVIRIK